jgi:hypothetical protein
MKALLPMFCAVLLIACNQVPEQKPSSSQAVSQTAETGYRIVRYTQPVNEIQPEFTITQKDLTITARCKNDPYPGAKHVGCDQLKKAVGTVVPETNMGYVVLTPELLATVPRPVDQHRELYYNPHGGSSTPCEGDCEELMVTKVQSPK